MKKIYYSFSSTIKLLGLIFLTMAGLQTAQAQLSCTPGQFSLDANGEYLVTGADVIQSTAFPVTEITLRLDGMNGPITPNPLTCSLLLGGPRTIAVMVETSDGNVCMTTGLLQDKFAPVLECPTRTIACDEDFNVNSMANPPTVSDNCSTGSGITLTMNQVFSNGSTGFSDAFDPSAATDNAASQNTTIAFNATNTELTINNSLIGGGLGMCNAPDMNDMTCAVVEVCYAIPATGTLSFDWIRDAVGPSNFPGVDPFGYSIDGFATNVSTLNSGTQNGSLALGVNSGETFCFLLGSNRVGPAFFATISNLEYDFDQANTCDNDYVIKRWTATDEYGNSSTCDQFIYRDTNMDITFPDSLLTTLGNAIECEEFNEASFEKDANGNPAVSESGEPTGCNISYTYTDVLIEGCANGQTAGCRKINRTFHIVDGCPPFTKTTYVQQIQIEDLVLPVISGLPATVDLGTSSSECISLDYTLPVPTVTDNCSSINDYTVSSSSGTIDNGVLSGLSIGTHTVTYQVSDCCGNLATEMITITVADNSPPTPVCESFRQVSLSTDGYGAILASSFDDGSHDNCNPVYFKVRRVQQLACIDRNGDDDLNKAGSQVYYDDEAFFCCDDLMQDSVQVVFRVFDVNPGNGPVLPSRMLVGGDLFGRFNDCMPYVMVMDNVAPSITCPGPQSVNCEHPIDLADLSEFGTATASGNCDLTVEEGTVTDNRNNCGLGTIEREFTVGNGSQTTTCTQVITVFNADPFTAADINWPADVTLTTCGADTSLANTGIPTFDVNRVCDQPSYSLTQQIDFSISDGCYKIIRTWRVMDWCQTPAVDTTRTQTIKVTNSIDPTVANNSTINEVICGAATTVDLTLTNTFADDCTATEDFAVQYAVDMGNDGVTEWFGGDQLFSFAGMQSNPSYNGATGVLTLPTFSFPAGTSRVIWIVEDKCGNVGTTEQLVVVSQNSPPVLNLDGLDVFNFTNLISGTMSAVDPDGDPITYISYEIILGAGLNLVTGVLTGTGNVLSEVEYSGAGLVTVNFLITDGCNDVTITLSQNAMSPQTATISGAISDATGQMVEAVHVDAGIGATQMTDDNGAYEFTPVETDQDYVVEPTKNDDPRNGLSTLDLVLIARHMIGLQPLDSPYKMIAADVTNDESIDGFDLIELQKLLIWNISEFTNNSSWRFVDAAYSFPNPSNPWAFNFPEDYPINGLAGNMLGLDFTAVKIGDVNGSAVANSMAPAQLRTVSGNYALDVQDQTLAANEVSTIDFVASEAVALNGLQLTLDLGQMNIEDYTSGLLNIDALTLIDGQYVISIAAAKPIKVEKGDVLFSLEVVSKNTTNIATELQLNNNLLTSEVYAGDNNLEIFDASIQVLSDAPITDVLYQNRPNPFKQNTTIGFYLANGGNANLSIYDVSGRQVYAVEGTYDAGYNQVEISAADIDGQGVMYYQIDTDTFTANRRMIIIK